jgi:hypothetical protein
VCETCVSFTHYVKVSPLRACEPCTALQAHALSHVSSPVNAACECTIQDLQNGAVRVGEDTFQASILFAHAREREYVANDVHCGVEEEREGWSRRRTSNSTKTMTQCVLPSCELMMLEVRQRAAACLSDSTITSHSSAPDDTFEHGAIINCSMV